MKGQFFLRDFQHPAWNMQHSELRHLLGVKGTKLPPEAMPPRLIQGILVWVAPALETGTRVVYGRTRKIKSSQHRVMARCPCCGESVSAGRLHQHVCKSGVGRLVAEAAEAARLRGHSLGRWEQTGGARWHSQCLRCTAWVQALGNPQPNEIDIGGPAVAIGCVPPFHNR
jgi:hypothetical protein